MVVLDGSAKKHRIAAYKSGEFPQGGEDPMADAVAELSAAAKELKVPEEAIGIAVDSGLAAFRTLKLPALDEAKVNDIIKFEVESQLPQWNIDDVVVDFMTLDKSDQELQLLVTAVPKAALQRELDLCTRAGVEPLDAEVEATAMVNAALAADVCASDEAQVLVHIGEASTAVVVVDGGHVRSMRAIHIGSLTHEAPPATDEGAEAGAGEKRAGSPSATPEDTARRLDQALSRIRRELGRTLSGARTVNPIKAVYVCGWELPGLVGTEVLETPVYELDAFVEDSGQPVQGAAPLVVAYGVALRQLGGAALRASLRREELRYTGAFERLEMPIAVAIMLLVMWLAVFNIFELRRVKNADANLGLWLKSNKNFLINNPKEGKRGHLEKPWAEIQGLVEKTALDQNDLVWTRSEQLDQIERELRNRQIKLNQELGNTGEVAQPQSALEALTLVCCTIDDLKGSIGRVAIRRVNANYVPQRTSTTDFVQVQLDLSFHNEVGVVAATGAFELLKSTLEKQPWVREVTAKTTKEFPDGRGIYTDQFTVQCDLTKVERAKEGS
jgi:hypothetical protein